MTAVHALLQVCVDAGQMRAMPPSAGTLATMVSDVHRQSIERLTPVEHGHWLAAMLMTARPSQAFGLLRAVTGLRRFLPELEALFGVPQLGDGPEWMDVGEHQLRLLDVLAARQAPLPLRFAALVHRFGMAGTPPEIWPSHHKHEQRSHEALDRLRLRSLWSDEAADLARLVIDEAQRVHRVSDLRAGPIAQMLLRLQAPARPARFEQLLEVCACDYAAHPGHDADAYPKAPRLRLALAAYLTAPVAGLPEDTALELRARAIDRALRPRIDADDAQRS